MKYLRVQTACRYWPMVAIGAFLLAAGGVFLWLDLNMTGAFLVLAGSSFLFFFYLPICCEKLRGYLSR